MIDSKTIDHITTATGSLMGIQEYLKKELEESPYPNVTNKIIKILDKCIENLNDAEEELMKDFDRQETAMIDARDWAKKYHV